ncbi:MAG: FKBP-type peptidyl-prolyl cis-trans isomerase [Bacteroidales bacterium]|nr:FKBP-type peptidyl-prolyl cis-trans isomerase [Bacteroidales bacterium]
MMKKNSFISLLIISTVLAFTLISCDPSKKYIEQEEDQIQDYLKSNPNLSFEQKPSGLYYVTIQQGTGIIPVKHDTAYIKYTGRFLSGNIFDTNVGTNDTLSVPVDEGWMIQGFDEGITYMKVGEKAQLLIPSKLAYGPTGYYLIGGYTPLLFDLELVKVKRGTGK